MDLIETFKWFHQHPEISYHEYDTTAKICEILDDENIPVTRMGLNTGCIATIASDNPGKTIGFRVDIDALAIEEKSECDYKSLNPGVAHLCGHDFHITIGLAVAIALHNSKDKWKGTVKIIFQAAEETGIGAKDVINHPLLQDISAYVGLHADPTNPVGTLGLRVGAVCAAVDRFVITVYGVGCHGAHPDDGKDPIVAALSIANALPTIISRNMNTFRPSLLSLTRIESGNTWNVVPSQATLEGTFRTMDANDRSKISKRIETLAVNIANGYDCQCECNIIHGAGVVFNDAILVAIATKVADKCSLMVVEEEQSMGGDDFSYYSESKPSVYVKVGTGVGPSIHQSNFRIDLAALTPASHYFTELLITLVNNH